MSAPPLDIPAVCFLEDICRLVRVSRSTVERLRRQRAFPIPELPPLDRRPRWSGVEVRKFLEGQSVPVRRRWSA